MPREERFGIGSKIDSLFIEMLDYLRMSSYASGEVKLTSLTNAIVRIDGLKFFLQLSWEVKLIAQGPYVELASVVEEIGKMVGGWRKGLYAKTPAPKAREK
jgi:hypothetical protein